MKKISGVYKIVNTVTGDFYVGSSRDVKKRWTCHMLPSTWKNQPHNKMYQDMQKYGVDKFRFQILAPVMPEHLKQVEQELIEMLKPTYNNRNAYGDDIERQKETVKNWYYRHKESMKKYRQTDKYKEREKKRRQTDRYKEYQKRYSDKYFHQLCSYNGETLTLKALLRRFQRMKIPHATMEAKKYLINTIQQ